LAAGLLRLLGLLGLTLELTFLPRSFFLLLLLACCLAHTLQSFKKIVLALTFEFQNGGSLHMASSSTDFDATRGWYYKPMLQVTTTSWKKIRVWAEEPVAPPAAAEAEPKNPREELRDKSTLGLAHA
ncbi:hypothetical protein Tco_0888452, partial [Tanacetum coccineum]